MRRGRKKKIVTSSSEPNTSKSSGKKTTGTAKRGSPRRTSQNREDPIVILDDSSSDIEVTETKDTTSSGDHPIENSCESSTPNEPVNGALGLCVNSETSEIIHSDEPSSNIRKRRERRCFPVLGENECENDDINSANHTSKIYTSQVQRCREKILKLESGLKNLNDLIFHEDSDSSDEPVVNTTVITKKRSPSKSPVKIKRPKAQKKLYSNLDKLISQHHADQTLLDSSLTDSTFPFADACTTPGVQTKTFLVRFQWKTRIITCHLDSNKKFCTLLPELASQLEVPADRLRFFLNGDLLDQSQTPADVNFNPGTFIECLASVDKAASNIPDVTEDADTIEIKIQCQKDRQKLSLKCNKLDPLQKVLREYAALKNLTPEQLTLQFDGDKVDPSESPDDIGLESGDCLDAIIH